VDVGQLRYNFTALFFQFLKFEAKGTLKDICILFGRREVVGVGVVPIIFIIEGWFCLVMVGFEVGGDGGVEMAGSPPLFFSHGRVGLVAVEDVAQHQGHKLYYNLTSAD
jgi:hypothetical protein